jgi:hypothetical protein
MTTLRRSQRASLVARAAALVAVHYANGRNKIKISTRKGIPHHPGCVALSRIYINVSAMAISVVVTKIRYFGTYIRYLPTNPTSHHCDNIPANPSWCTDIFRYHFRISTSSSTVELVYSVRILSDDTSQKL